LLFAKKIKKFISIPHIHLAISVNRKIENFRTKRASLCKGWRDYVFFVKRIKKKYWIFKETEMENFLTKNGNLFGAEFSYFRPLFWRGVLSQMQGFCLALYHRNIEIFRGLGTRQVTQQLGKGTAKKRIELSFGKWAIIDAEDYDRLSMYNWCAVRMGQNWYAKTLKRDGMSLAMHRLITNAPKYLVVDHMDHNGLNNRKSNLRLCTPAQNQYNARPIPGGTSKHKGVCRDRKSKKYRALIGHKSKRYHLGCFDNEDDAGRAYDRKAIELFGEFAYLNFPDEDYGPGGGGF
jgi:hypothetical protein